MKIFLLMILIGMATLIYVNRVDLVRSVQRVDATSPQTMRASVEEINKGLSDEEKLIFAKGMMKLAAEGIDLPTMMAMTGDDEVQWTMFSKQLNGKSTREILAKGRN